MKKGKKDGQNLIEYILIFALIAMAGYFFVEKFDFQKIKNYVFNRPTYKDTNGYEKIKIESMTE